MDTDPTQPKTTRTQPRTGELDKIFRNETADYRYLMGVELESPTPKDPTNVDSHVPNDVSPT